MRALWKGAISFGLVSISVSLFPATRREELKFRLLRRSDLSPVNYKRVAETDGKEVPWEQIVKGYEYEKGKFVVLKEEDFARVDVEATQTVDIINFVEIDEVEPLLFYKPYYLEVGKGGDKAYVLLRKALSESGKIAIAKVVIRARQHLAAIKPQKGGLILELMHFPENLMPGGARVASFSPHPFPVDLEQPFPGPAANRIGMRLTSLKLNSLRDLLLEELRDLYDAEKQLVAAIPKMADAAKASDLKSAFTHHLDQTKQHVSRLEGVFADLGEKASGETCEAMKGLIKEGELIIKAEGDPDVRDAGLIGAAQRVEHYEMAGYGTARTLARRLGQEQMASVLQETLNEEGEADKKLTEIAERQVNVSAARR